MAAPPLFPPGTGWSYSNTNYVLLGLVVERVEGAPFADVLERRLLRPLGLAHTLLRRSGDDAPVVRGHDHGRPIDASEAYARAWAAGGLASSAEDLVGFWHALLAGRVLSARAVHAMWSDLAPMSAEGRPLYGRGVELDEPAGPGLLLGHSGGIPGFTATVAWLAEDDAYVAVLVNEKEVPAEAGLWELVRALRAWRAEQADADAPAAVRSGEE